MCVKVKKRYSIFHFKGVYNGHKINSIILDCNEFEVDEEYLLYVDVVSIKNGTLYGKIITKKLLFPNAYSD